MFNNLEKVEKEFHYFKNDVVKWQLLKILRPWKVEPLKRNKELKNTHIGDRCFILGNGPSIKDVNFSNLTDEFVFTVNQASRYKDFDKLKTNVHMWADQYFFKRLEFDEELVEVMKNIRTKDNSPYVFVPVNQKPFMERLGLDKILDLRYFRSETGFFEGYNHEIDYAKMSPAFGTVVQWCITMAIFMGFKEIYLLGCDNTGLMTNFKSVLQRNDAEDYGYDISANDKKQLENMLKDKGLEGYVVSYLANMREYRWLKKYCDDRNIKLINCSSQTVIDTIPRMRLDDVLRYS